MRFLKLRTDAKPRANGDKNITPLIVDTPRRYSKQRKEQALRKKRCQLITGGHDSGKTRWLNRLYDHHQGIWGAKDKTEPVFISALMPLAGWIDFDGIVRWHNKSEEAQAKQDESHILRLWCNLNQQQKLALLPEYVAATKAVVYIDDAHKLTGRKAQIARQCVLSARLWLISALQENRLPPSLRTVVERREPQRTKLLTDVSYDATGLLMWLMVFAAFAVGWWEASLVLGGLKMLGSGRRASRQD